MFDRSPEKVHRRLKDEGLTEDCASMALHVGGNRSVSEYELWRALKTLNNAIYILERKHQPIPIDLVFARAIVRGAQIVKQEFP